MEPASVTEYSNTWAGYSGCKRMVDPILII